MFMVGKNKDIWHTTVTWHSTLYNFMMIWKIACGFSFFLFFFYFLMPNTLNKYKFYLASKLAVIKKGNLAIPQNPFNWQFSIHICYPQVKYLYKTCIFY